MELSGSRSDPSVGSPAASQTANLVSNSASPGASLQTPEVSLAFLASQTPAELLTPASERSVIPISSGATHPLLLANPSSVESSISSVSLDRIHSYSREVMSLAEMQAVFEEQEMKAAEKVALAESKRVAAAENACLLEEFKAQQRAQVDELAFFLEKQAKRKAKENRQKLRAICKCLCILSGFFIVIGIISGLVVLLRPDKRGNSTALTHTNFTTPAMLSPPMPSPTVSNSTTLNSSPAASSGARPKTTQVKAKSTAKSGKGSKGGCNDYQRCLNQGQRMGGKSDFQKLQRAKQYDPSQFQAWVVGNQANIMQQVSAISSAWSSNNLATGWSDELIEFVRDLFGSGNSIAVHIQRIIDARHATNHHKR